MTDIVCDICGKNANEIGVETAIGAYIVCNGCGKTVCGACLRGHIDERGFCKDEGSKTCAVCGEHTFSSFTCMDCGCVLCDTCSDKEGFKHFSCSECADERRKRECATQSIKALQEYELSFEDGKGKLGYLLDALRMTVDAIMREWEDGNV